MSIRGMWCWAGERCVGQESTCCGVPNEFRKTGKWILDEQFRIMIVHCERWGMKEGVTTSTTFRDASLDFAFEGPWM